MVYKQIILFLIIVLFVSACSLTPAATPTSIPESIPVDLPSPEALPSATASASVEVLPSPTADLSVIITATTGSLAIRRGPGTAYNVLGFLKDGESAVASARDTAGSWLYIPIPSNPSLSGWVSAVTQYSTLAGEISSLEIMTVGPAEPISIRNCTFHPMLITPLNVVLAAQTDATANLASVLPGDYAAFDQSVEGEPQVKTMSLLEGNSVDITTDGLGNTYACP